MQFRHRSDRKEILDQEDIAPHELHRNLYELHIINKQLGGYSVSRSGLDNILSSGIEIKTLLDIGFGGGHMIGQLSAFSEKNNYGLYFFGVDLKNDCLSYAEKTLQQLAHKELICADYRNIPDGLMKNVDVLHCSLFLHHLSDSEIVDLFKFARKHGCILLVNDLHRHWFAFYSIKVLTSLFSKSRLVKNDAPLSVKRGFKKYELISLLKKAGFKDFNVEWCWAFRYRIIARE